MRPIAPCDPGLVGVKGLLVILCSPLLVGQLGDLLGELVGTGTMPVTSRLGQSGQCWPSVFEPPSALLVLGPKANWQMSTPTNPGGTHLSPPPMGSVSSCKTSVAGWTHWRQISLPKTGPADC